MAPGPLPVASSPYPWGIVVSDAGAPAGITGATTTTMRSGRCVVPDLWFDTLAAAKVRLKSAGCTVGKISRAYSIVPKNWVLGQQPAAYTDLASGGVVKLFVSNGRKPVGRNA